MSQPHWWAVLGLTSDIWLSRNSMINFAGQSIVLAFMASDFLRDRRQY